MEGECWDDDERGISTPGQLDDGNGTRDLKCNDWDEGGWTFLAVEMARDMASLRCRLRSPESPAT